MSSRSGSRIVSVCSVTTMIVAAVAFIVTLALNSFVFDDYDAYGEVPIPGTASVRLPAGDVTVSFHTLLVGSTSGSGLPVPPLKYRIEPPPGVDEPRLTEDYGATTSVNNDARVRIGYLHVPVDGTYRFTTDGRVGPYLNPRLAFGHGSTHGSLNVVFAVVFGIGALGLVAARVWATRSRRREMAVGHRSPTVDVGAAPTWSAGTYTPQPTQPTQPPPAWNAPNGEGIRIQQLNTLARLRDSGALTEDEYAAEKKRVLDDL